MSNWFNLETPEVVTELKTHPHEGLSAGEAAQRLDEYGKNELKEKEGKSILAILFDQVKETLVLILLAAAVVSLLLGEHIDGIIIFIIVLLNTVLGFWQEFKSEKAIQALKKLTVPRVRVKRDGQAQTISAKELVPGDLLLVEAGNIVPADARLLEAANLKVRESMLTGESEPVMKHTRSLPSTNPPIGDRKNMLYMGTIITYGRGEAVVTGTGMNTELGKIATMLQEVKDEITPLQKRLARLGTIFTIGAMGLIALVTAISLLRGFPLKETFMTAISMAVAAIPEGLPAVVTIALALGARRMLGKNALIRNLPSVETLGSVTVICSDKTGTLTQNRMTVVSLTLIQETLDLEENPPPPEALAADAQLLLMAGCLCNDSEPGPGGEILGDPTETALVSAASAMRIDKKELETTMPRVNELPFDSGRKLMTTIHRVPKPEGPLYHYLYQLDGPVSHVAFTKGSPDVLVELADRIVVGDRVKKLDKDYREKIIAANEKLAADGIRVLGMAFKPVKGADAGASEDLETKLVLLGMAGMIDPVRPEVVEAVTECREAGIRPVMITGDHPLTARHIARELGMTADDRCLTGRDLSGLSAAELSAVAPEVSVYARVSPEHKMNLVDALQARGEIVSMTGDGVNDAPALKSADIGVAMGITGTDVAKESSDMVLLDDNFASIVAAVKEGRTIYDNIKKFLKYILSGNIGEIVVMLLGPLFGMPIPLLPIQILWINLVTDGLPAVALGYEPTEKETMKRPPVRPGESIFAGGIGARILVVGMLVGLASLGVGFYVFRDTGGAGPWQTMSFTTLTFCQMLLALSFRFRRDLFFRRNPFSNLFLLVSVLITFALQLALIYVPFLQKLFHTQPLTGGELFTCFIAAAGVFAASETIKLFTRKR